MGLWQPRGLSALVSRLAVVATGRKTAGGIFQTTALLRTSGLEPSAVQVLQPLSQPLAFDSSRQHHAFQTGLGIEIPQLLTEVRVSLPGLGYLRPLTLRSLTALWNPSSDQGL